MHILRFAGLLAILAVAGCSQLGAGEVRLVGPYYVVAATSRQDMALYYAPGREGRVGQWIPGPSRLRSAERRSVSARDSLHLRVGPTVFALGRDDRHIIVKRHPGGDRSITEYFILTRAVDTASSGKAAAVTRPLTAAEFADARRRLGVSETLGFSFVLRDLE
jgi:hypothetical protein